jgi:hypothetical protein
MRDFEPYKDDWKDDVGKAVARFIVSVTAMVPLIAGALAVGLFFHSLFAEPFGFTCKSLPADRHSTTVKRRADTIREIPSAPRAMYEAPVIKIKPMKSEPDQESKPKQNPITSGPRTARISFLVESVTPCKFAQSFQGLAPTLRDCHSLLKRLRLKIERASRAEVLLIFPPPSELEAYRAGGKIFFWVIAPEK